MVSSTDVFMSLSFRQKTRWLAHFFKVSFKHKERKRSLSLASHVPPGGTIIDVGAHLGYLTKEFALAHHGNIKVIAFEPGDYCLSILKLVVRKLPNVSLVAVGLGEEDGVAELKTPLKKDGMLGIGVSQLGGDLSREHKTSSVKVMRLDSFVLKENISKVDLLKVDVEGGELNILKGAKKLIEDCKPIWYMEVDGTMTKRFGYEPEDLFSFLGQYGYKPYLLMEDSSLKPVNSYSGTNDYFFKVD